jgi:hypothetical protein
VAGDGNDGGRRGLSVAVLGSWAPEGFADIAAKVDAKRLEQTLMDEGLRNRADPQKALLAPIAAKRVTLAGVE